MIEQITVNPINESLFSADFIKGFRCGAKRQFQADVEEIAKAKFGRPTGEWVLDPNGMDWNIPAWRCSECGFVANYIGVEANGMGKNPMNWVGSKFCPNCGARMYKGGEDE